MKHWNLLATFSICISLSYQLKLHQPKPNYLNEFANPMDFLVLDGQRINKINDNGVNQIQNNDYKSTYNEDRDFCTYWIKTPVLPQWVTSKDIIVELTSSTLHITARGSGSSLNKLFAFPPETATRDWELWLNLRQVVDIKSLIPVKGIKHNVDNTFEVTVRVNRNNINLYDQPTMKVHPLYFLNTTETDAFIDLYHTTIPKKPHYIRRSIDTGGELLETFTVTDKNSQDAKNLKISKNGVERGAETINTLKNYSPLDAKATLVNLDQFDHYDRYSIQADTSIKHDKAYYEVLNQIPAPKGPYDSVLYNDFLKNNRNYHINQTTKNLQSIPSKFKPIPGK